MTSASTERGIASDSGEMLPLENANRPPASPANTPASAKPRHCVRTHVDAERCGAQRRIARAAQREAERRARDAHQCRASASATTTSVNQ